MKKKALSLLLALGLCALCAGCTQPDALTLDLSHGYGQHTKLIHLNASSSQKDGQYIDFYYEGEEQLYRSHTTAEEFRQLVHQN